MGLKSFGDVLRATSRAVQTMGGGAGPRARREHFRNLDILEQEREQEAQAQSTERLKVLETTIRTEMEKNPEGSPKRIQQENVLREIQGLLQDRGVTPNISPVNAPEVERPSGLTVEAEDRINAALDSLVDTNFDDTVKPFLSSEIFDDPTKRRDVILSVKKEMQKNPNRSLKQLVLQDGSSRPVFVDNQGKFFEIDGTQLTPPSNSTITNTPSPTGSNQDIGIGIKAANTLEDRIINAGNRMQRVQNIMENFNPEFLNTFNQLYAKGLAQVERFGFDLGEEQRQFLEDFSTFSLDVASDLNATIKEITGAQMSEAEAERISKEVATLGDSPTEFAAKSKRILQNLEAVQTRAQILRSKGFSDQQIADMSSESNFIVGGLTLRDAVNYNAMIDKMISQGKSDDEIEAALKKEFNL